MRTYFILKLYTSVFKEILKKNLNQKNIDVYFEFPFMNEYILHMSYVTSWKIGINIISVKNNLTYVTLRLAYLTLGWDDITLDIHWTQRKRPNNKWKLGLKYTWPNTNPLSNLG